MRDTKRRDSDHALLREGTYNMVPLMPILTTRELAKIDSEGIFNNIGLTRHIQGIRRALALHNVNRRFKVEAKTRAVADEIERTGDESLPVPGMNAIGLSSYTPSIPWHMATISESRLLNPMGVSGWSKFRGPVIGRSLVNGNLWRYDAWSPYQYDKTSVNGLILGMMGSGKSTVLKVLSLRETLPPWNRHILIEGDPKGEWAIVAKAVGGQVVEVGSGQYLNPLDPGVRPANYNKEQWDDDLLGNQVSSLKTIAHVLRPNQEFTPREAGLTSAALRELNQRKGTATIAHFVELLSSDWRNGIHVPGLEKEDVLRTANDLVLLFGQMVTGGESGAFERESTVHLDPQSPMIVFNTGSEAMRNDTKKALYTACMNSSVEQLCSRHDGLFRIIIGEEGYELLKNPKVVESWDKRMRLTGDQGTSSWMLLHELSDITKFAPGGTEQFEQIKSVLTKAGVQVIYKQSASSMNLMAPMLGDDLSSVETATISNLQPHCGLWRVGSKVRDVVKADFGQEVRELVDTEKYRAG